MLLSELASDENIRASGLIHRVYLPEKSLVGEKKPLVLFVHGRSGDASVMWAFSKVVGALRPVVIAPQAHFKDEGGGWSWWDVFEDSPDGRVRKKRTLMQDMFPAIEKLEAFIQVLPDLYNVDTRKIIAIGFSQGGALLSAMSVCRATPFSGVALLASFLPSAALEAFSPERGIACRNFFIGHGSRDEVVPLERAEWSRKELEKLGGQVTFAIDDVGHKAGSGVVRDLSSWVQDCLIRFP